jgi:hypothetical protein
MDVIATVKYWSCMDVIATVKMVMLKLMQLYNCYGENGDVEINATI